MNWTAISSNIAILGIVILLGKLSLTGVIPGVTGSTQSTGAKMSRRRAANYISFVRLVERLELLLGQPTLKLPNDGLLTVARWSVGPWYLLVRDEESFLYLQAGTLRQLHFTLHMFPNDQSFESMWSMVKAYLSSGKFGAQA